jgi:hypothetical protein
MGGAWCEIGGVIRSDAGVRIEDGVTPYPWVTAGEGGCSASEAIRSVCARVRSAINLTGGVFGQGSRRKGRGSTASGGLALEKPTAGAREWAARKPGLSGAHHHHPWRVYACRGLMETVRITRAEHGCPIGVLSLCVQSG